MIALDSNSSSNRMIWYTLDLTEKFKVSMERALPYAFSKSAAYFWNTFFILNWIKLVFNVNMNSQSLHVDSINHSWVVLLDKNSTKQTFCSAEWHWCSHPFFFWNSRKRHKFRFEIEIYEEKINKKNSRIIHIIYSRGIIRQLFQFISSLNRVHLFYFTFCHPWQKLILFILHILF